MVKDRNVGEEDDMGIVRLYIKGIEKTRQRTGFNFGITCRLGTLAQRSDEVRKEIKGVLCSIGQMFGEIVRRGMRLRKD